MPLALSLSDIINSLGKAASDNPYLVLTTFIAIFSGLVRWFYTAIVKDSFDRQSNIAEDYRQQYLDCRDSNRHLEAKIEKLENEIDKMDEEFRASRSQFISIISDLKSGYKVIRSDEDNE